MTGIIYHLCRKADWETCRLDGDYTGSDAALADGFLHASTAAQVQKSANLHMAGFTDLLLIIIDAAALDERLKWETSRSGALFPHIYGAVPQAAVITARAVPLTDAGYDFTAFPAIIAAGADQ